MRFEHLLEIYWVKGFFYNTLLIPFKNTLVMLLKLLNGLSWTAFYLIKERFEVITSRKLSPTLLKPLNIFFSQISSVNNKNQELTRLILIKLFLIKSMRGCAHALGKPSRGQRTWSNAWTAYNLNFVTRKFILHFQRIFKKTELKESLDRRYLSKIVLKKGSKLSLRKKKTYSQEWF